MALNMDHPAQHPPVIDPRLAPRSRKERLQPLHRCFRQPETPAHDPSPKSGARITPRAVDQADSWVLSLVASREGEDFELTRGQETELPQALKWQVARSDEDYYAAMVEARRITVDTTRIASESFHMAIPPEGEAGCANGGQRAHPAT
jgi:hypothetical protein